MTDELYKIKQDIFAFRDARNWKQFHSPRSLAISLAVEAAELLEHFQWEENPPPLAASKQEKVSDEIADIAMYLLELSDLYGVDLIEAIRKKLEKNGRKYPVEKSWGSAKKYTEL